MTSSFRSMVGPSALVLVVVGIACSGRDAPPKPEQAVPADPVAAATPPAPPPETAQAPTPSHDNILLLILDACRADKLGAYGYDERPVSPAIDAVAKDPDSVLFRRHYAQAGWTKASVASLFTGKYVFQHGVVLGDEGKDKGPAKPGVFATHALAESHDTMAERLSAHGMHTFAVAKSQHLRRELGFQQGFSTYVEATDLSNDLARVERTLELVKATQLPFFGYVHLNACHHPFKEKERSAEIMQLAPEYDEQARQRAGIDFTQADIKRSIGKGKTKLTPRDVAYLRVLYDAQLRWVDEQMVRPLVEGLKQMGRYDDTMLLISADHGEELYDHEGYAHGDVLFEEVVHVPLIVKFPRGKRPPALARDVKQLTQQIDLLPTFLTWLDAPGADALPGADVFTGKPGDVAHMQTASGWALIHGHMKLIEHERGGLFDLEKDPHEQNDLSKKMPDAVRDMRVRERQLRKTVRGEVTDVLTVERELDSTAIEELRSLGYVQ